MSRLYSDPTLPSSTLSYTFPRIHFQLTKLTIPLNPEQGRLHELGSSGWDQGGEGSTHPSNPNRFLRTSEPSPHQDPNSLLPPMSCLLRDPHSLHDFYSLLHM